MDDAKILLEEIAKYKDENERFDTKVFDSVQVLNVVFRAMDRVKTLNIDDVSKR